MKIQWTAFFSLFTLMALVGCGSEQFGSVPQSTTSTPSGLQSFQQLSCSSFTLVKPKVDILYVVDNSASSYYLSSDIKTAVKNTVDSISQEFDYRVIGTTLIPDSSPYNDYQIMTNSTDPLSSEAVGRKVISSSELTFFSNPGGGSNETGLRRIAEFMDNHRGTSTSLFRQNAYHIIVLVSNGRDIEVEEDPYGTGQTRLNSTNFNSRLSSFNSIRSGLQSQQLRLFTVTAKQHNCQSGWRGSLLSYVKMANQLYGDSGATDNNSNRDSYDLCTGGLSSIFSAVNGSIKQVIVPHGYRYWPITFAEKTENNVSISEIQVYKVSGNSAPVLMPASSWSYRYIPGGVNTRALPSVGEYNSGSHFVEFNSGSYVTYPDCVQVNSVSRTEYFGYVVLPREPQLSTLVLRINGTIVPQDPTNGWSYRGNITTNIKMAHPNAGDELPQVEKTGYMLQLNGANNYYKSGDNVEVNYLPAGI